jgi:hypothetical protein
VSKTTVYTDTASSTGSRCTSYQQKFGCVSMYFISALSHAKETGFLLELFFLEMCLILFTYCYGKNSVDQSGAGYIITKINDIFRACLPVIKHKIIFKIVEYTELY